MSLELTILDIGKKSYEDAWKIQKELFERRKKREVCDTLILAEHSPTISFGANEEWNKLHVSKEELEKLGIYFVKSERGGGAAYLGPGQLVGYTIMEIRKFGGVLSFMMGLEETMIKTAHDFGIQI